MAWAALGKAALGAIKGGAKAAAGAAKSGAKKIATDKMLNRKKRIGKRRAKAQQIMGGGEEQEQGGKAVDKATGGMSGGGGVKDKKPSPRISTKKFLPTKPGGGARITAEQVQILKGINVTLKNVSGNLKDNLVLSKIRHADKKERLAQKKRDKRQLDLKGKKQEGGGGGRGKGPNVPGKGILGSIMDGFLSLLWGMLVVKMVDWMENPHVQKFMSGAFAVGKWIIDAAGWLLESFISLIDWGYKLYDGAVDWMKNTFGEDAAEKFEGFMDGVKSIFQSILFVKVILRKIVDRIIKQVTTVFKRIGWVIKQAYRLAKFVIRTAIKAAKFILKTALKAMRLGGRLINWATRGRAGNLVNAARKGVTDFVKTKRTSIVEGVKAQRTKLVQGVKDRLKTFKPPKIQAPSWWKRGREIVSRKVSEGGKWATGLQESVEKSIKNLMTYIDDISKPLREAGERFAQRIAKEAENLNPVKKLEKLKAHIDDMVKRALDKNPFVKKIMGWVSNKGKGAAKWIGNNVKKIAKNPKLKKLADGLKKSKGASKGLGPVDKIITALMALFEYVKGGESPVNVILKGLGGLIGYGLGFSAGNALVPGIGGFIGGIGGSVAGEWIAHKTLQGLAKHTPLDEIEDPVMGKEDIAAGKPARMLLRPTEHLGDHMKGPGLQNLDNILGTTNNQAGDDANAVSTSASYETGGGEGSTKIIPVEIPAKSSLTTQPSNKSPVLSGSSSSGEKSDYTEFVYKGS